MHDPRTLEEGSALTAPLPVTSEPEPEIAARQLTQTQLTWIRFRRHKPAMIGSVMILLMVALALFAPVITPENPYNQLSWDATNINLTPRLHPAWFYVMGTDLYGHTIFSQIAWGARVSLTVGFVGSFGATVIGVIIGAVAGYFGGWVDTIVMRITDVFLTLPFLPLLIVSNYLFGSGSGTQRVTIVITIFIVFFWPVIARLTRASFLSLREREFAEAARSVGVGAGRIIFRHLLPNALRPILVATTLNIAAFITTEAAIDYLGTGIQYPDASWGNILTDAQNDLFSGNWWWAAFPGIFLVLTVLSVNFIGDGLGDALDVRSKP